jgi:hypothetical protein
LGEGGTTWYPNIVRPRTARRIKTLLNVDIVFDCIHYPFLWAGHVGLLIQVQKLSGCPDNFNRGGFI